MTPAEVESASNRIVKKLFAEVDWRSIKSLHTFVPISKLNEVNTWPLLKHIWQNHPRIQTAIPTARRGQYGSIRVNQATRWRGLLPSSTLAVPEDFRFDLIVVPTLAFDERLYRLGWGSGFYDRFLSGQESALKIGLCFENGRVAKMPEEAHDIRLDKIITEEGILIKS